MVTCEIINPLVGCVLNPLDPTCNNDGEVRLTDNTTSTEGRVEICELGFRAGLCYENFIPEIARVLCRQLGLSTNNASKYTSKSFVLLHHNN